MSKGCDLDALPKRSPSRPEPRGQETTGSKSTRFSFRLSRVVYQRVLLVLHIPAKDVCSDLAAVGEDIATRP